MAVTQKLFTELFRAKALEHMFLPQRIISELAEGLVTHTFLYGPAGSGKTTIARILTEGYEVLKLNGSSENGIDVIRNQVVDFASTMSLTGGEEKVKVVFIDEADGLTENAWDALRETLERYCDSVRYVCTCNKFNKIPDPIKSRFKCIPVYPVNAEEERYVFDGYCEHIGRILTKIKVEYDQETLVAFVKSSFPDMRTLLNNVQALYTQGATVLDKNSIVKTFECSDLMQLIISGMDPVENYKFIMSNYSSYPDDVMLSLSHTFVDFIRVNYPQYSAKIPLVILTIAEYMSQLPMAPDKILVMLACCFKLQMIIKE